MKSLPQALAPLAHYHQFVIVKLIPRDDGSGKTDKLPVDHRTGQIMQRGIDWQNDPAAWTDATTAIHMALAMGDDHCIGFLFTSSDPFVFIDLDNCLIDNQWSPVAVELCSRMAGASIEISQSGKGLHIIGAATSIPDHGCKNSEHGLELYHTGRFVALTGTGAVGNAAHDLTAVLPALVADYFPPSSGQADSGQRPTEWTTAPRPEYTGPQDDDQLIALMLKSGQGSAGQVFGNKASLADLWNADTEALSRAYPDNYGSRAYDASAADAALAAHLAFWTGGDCERVLRLMWQSGLIRDKWVDNHSYLKEFTITKAVSRCAVVYTGGKKQTTDAVPVDNKGVDLPFQATAETYSFLGARDRRLVRFNGQFFTSEQAGYYRELSDEVIRAEIRTSIPWQLTPSKVSATEDEIKSAMIMDAHGIELPHWMTPVADMPDARGLIVCRNGILDPVTNTLYPHNDNLLTFNALPFDYNPSADVPIRWMQFLAETFVNDAESIHELQKLFGYLLTLDTSQQKIFGIIGPKRSGKGTIARVLRQLIGPDNTCAPSFNTIGGDFGLASLIGKQVAIFPDSRIGRRTDKAIVAERLLSISGEDALDVGRKHKDNWHGKLTTRVLMLSNEVPVFGDASGALASRYVIFHTPHSCYGAEDKGLTDTLLKELPGILNWSLEGLQMLRVEGDINTPAMATELVDEIDSLGSPVKAFVSDMCKSGSDYMVSKDALWSAYRKWHNDHGVSGHPMSKEMFARNLKTAYPGQFKDYRPFIDGKRSRYWLGLTLHSLADDIFGDNNEE